jgi:serine/threonine protein kinase
VRLARGSEAADHGLVEVSGQRQFTFGACLGKGGFGEVYRATMSTSGGISREVAVKLLRADLGSHDEAVRRLRDEGKLLARLDHPALLTVHDLVVLNERVALVTEFVDGEDLATCLRGAPPMPLRPLLQAIGAAADALHAAWSARHGPLGAPLRLVHRDIKPSNLRVSRHGQLKVLDFGIARTDEVTREARTATDFIVGSPAYMAPERFLDNQVRSASDVFALGCTLFEGLTGERLFAGANPMMQSTLALDRDRFEQFVAERPLPPDLPDGVAELVRDCLRFDPSVRPSAGALSRRCEELADRVGGPSLARWAKDREWPTSGFQKGDFEGRVVTLGTIDSAPPASSAPGATPSGRWRRGLLFAGAAALLALIGVLGMGAAGGVGLWWSGQFAPAEAPGVAPSTEAAGAVPEIPDVGPTEPDLVTPGLVTPADPLPEPETARVDPAPTGVRPTVRPSSSAAPPSEPSPAPATTVVVRPAPPPPSGPAPTPSPPAATVSVRLDGDVDDVSLTRGAETVPLRRGASVGVAAGAWRIVTLDPVLGRRDHGPVEIPSEGGVRVSCSASMSTCRARIVAEP